MEDRNCNYYFSRLLILVLFCVTSYLGLTSASKTELTFPVPRQSVWQYGYSKPQKLVDGWDKCKKTDAKECGYCGRGSQSKDDYSRIMYINRFTEGSAVRMSADIDNIQKGNMYVSLCVLKNDFPQGDNNCVKDIALDIQRQLTSSNDNPIHVPFTVRLPRGITCEHCIFRWQFIEENKSCPECALKTINCADISIEEKTTPSLTSPRVKRQAKKKKKKKSLTALLPLLPKLKKSIAITVKPSSPSSPKPTAPPSFLEQIRRLRQKLKEKNQYANINHLHTSASPSSLYTKGGLKVTDPTMEPLHTATNENIIYSDMQPSVMNNEPSQTAEIQNQITEQNIQPISPHSSFLEAIKQMQRESSLRNGYSEQGPEKGIFNPVDMNKSLPTTSPVKVKSFNNNKNIIKSVEESIPVYIGLENSGKKYQYNHLEARQTTETVADKHIQPENVISQQGQGHSFLDSVKMLQRKQGIEKIYAELKKDSVPTKEQFLETAHFPSVQRISLKKEPQSNSWNSKDQYVSGPSTPKPSLYAHEPIKQNTVITKHTEKTHKFPFEQNLRSSFLDQIEQLQSTDKKINNFDSKSSVNYLQDQQRSKHPPNDYTKIKPEPSINSVAGDSFLQAIKRLQEKSAKAEYGSQTEPVWTDPGQKVGRNTITTPVKPSTSVGPEKYLDTFWPESSISTTSSLPHQATDLNPETYVDTFWSELSTSTTNNLPPQGADLSPTVLPTYMGNENEMYAKQSTLIDPVEPMSSKPATHGNEKIGYVVTDTTHTMPSSVHTTSSTTSKPSKKSTLGKHRKLVRQFVIIPPMKGAGAEPITTESTQPEYTFEQNPMPTTPNFFEIMSFTKSPPKTLREFVMAKKRWEEAKANGVPYLPVTRSPSTSVAVESTPGSTYETMPTTTEYLSPIDTFESNNVNMGNWTDMQPFTTTPPDTSSASSTSGTEWAYNGYNNEQTAESPQPALIDFVKANQQTPGVKNTEESITYNTQPPSSPNLYDMFRQTTGKNDIINTSPQHSIHDSRSHPAVTDNYIQTTSDGKKRHYYGTTSETKKHITKQNKFFNTINGNRDSVMGTSSSDVYNEYQPGLTTGSLDYTIRPNLASSTQTNPVVKHNQKDEISVNAFNELFGNNKIWTTTEAPTAAKPTEQPTTAKPTELPRQQPGKQSTTITSTSNVPTTATTKPSTTFLTTKTTTDNNHFRRMFDQQTNMQYSQRNNHANVMPTQETKTNRNVLPLLTTVTKEPSTTKQPATKTTPAATTEKAKIIFADITSTSPVYIWTSPYIGKTIDHAGPKHKTHLGKEINKNASPFDVNTSKQSSSRRENILEKTKHPPWTDPAYLELFNSNKNGIFMPEEIIPSASPSTLKKFTSRPTTMRYVNPTRKLTKKMETASPGYPVKRTSETYKVNKNPYKIKTLFAESTANPVTSADIMYNEQQLQLLKLQLEIKKLQLKLKQLDQIKSEGYQVPVYRERIKTTTPLTTTLAPTTTTTTLAPTTTTTVQTTSTTTLPTTTTTRTTTTSPTPTTTMKAKTTTESLADLIRNFIMVLRPQQYQKIHGTGKKKTSTTRAPTTTTLRTSTTAKPITTTIKPTTTTTEPTTTTVKPTTTTAKPTTTTAKPTTTTAKPTTTTAKPTTTTPIPTTTPLPTTSTTKPTAGKQSQTSKSATLINTIMSTKQTTEAESNMLKRLLKKWRPDLYYNMYLTTTKGPLLKSSKPTVSPTTRITTPVPTITTDAVSSTTMTVISTMSKRKKPTNAGVYTSDVSKATPPITLKQFVENAQSAKIPIPKEIHNYIKDAMTRTEKSATTESNSPITTTEKNKSLDAVVGFIPDKSRQPASQPDLYVPTPGIDPGFGDNPRTTVAPKKNIYKDVTTGYPVTHKIGWTQSYSSTNGNIKPSLYSMQPANTVAKLYTGAPKPTKPSNETATLLNTQSQTTNQQSRDAEISKIIANYRRKYEIGEYKDIGSLIQNLFTNDILKKAMQENNTIIQTYLTTIQPDNNIGYRTTAPKISRVFNDINMKTNVQETDYNVRSNSISGHSGISSPKLGNPPKGDISPELKTVGKGIFSGNSPSIYTFIERQSSRHGIQAGLSSPGNNKNRDIAVTENKDRASLGSMSLSSFSKNYAKKNNILLPKARNLSPDQSYVLQNEIMSKNLRESTEGQTLREQNYLFKSRDYTDSSIFSGIDQHGNPVPDVQMGMYEFNNRNAYAGTVNMPIETQEQVVQYNPQEYTGPVVISPNGAVLDLDTVNSINEADATGGGIITSDSLGSNLPLVAQEMGASNSQGRQGSSNLSQPPAPHHGGNFSPNRPPPHRPDIIGSGPRHTGGLSGPYPAASRWATRQTTHRMRRSTTRQHLLEEHYLAVNRKEFCSTNEEFECMGKGNYKNETGIKWFCMSRCAKHRCPVDKCECGCRDSMTFFWRRINIK